MDHLHGFKRDPNVSDSILIGFELLPEPRPIFRKKSEAFQMETICESEENTRSSVVMAEKITERNSSPNQEINNEETKIVGKGDTVGDNFESPLKESVDTDSDDDIFGFNSVVKEDVNLNQHMFASKKAKRRLPFSFVSSDSSQNSEDSHSLKISRLSQMSAVYEETFENNLNISLDADKQSQTSNDAKEADDDKHSQTSNDAKEEDGMCSDDSEGGDIDSDYETGDNEVYTKLRQNNKRIRHMSRNVNVMPLHLKPGNKEFVEQFTTFLKRNTIDNSNTETSTIVKANRHLFEADDSLLAQEVEKNGQFKLQNWISFNQETFCHLKYPLDWLTSTCVKNGSKGCERLKAHSWIRNFIEYKVDQVGDNENLSNIKATVRENIQAINKQITKNKLFPKYSSLANQATKDKKRAHHLLKPSQPINIEYIVSKWSSSLEKEETDRDFQFIYDTAIENNHISISNLTRYAIYSRLMLLLRLYILKCVGIIEISLGVLHI